MSAVYEDCLSDFRPVISLLIKIVSIIIEAKKNLEKKKLKYYESCKLIVEHEKTVCRTFSGKINSTDEEINNANDTLLKIKSQAEHCGQLYKYEISALNKVYEESENKYKKVLGKMEATEENRTYFIKSNIEKFSKLFEEFTLSAFDFLNVAFIFVNIIFSFLAFKYHSSAHKCRGRLEIL